MIIFASQNKLEAEISKRAAEACDQIISEMGAEIHDDLVQKLSIFRLYIDRIERASADKTEIELLVIKMRNDFEQVAKSIKNISRRLLPTNIEGESLVDMLEILCQNMEQPGIGNVHFEHTGSSKSLENNVQIHLLRIVQELIHNALKHSSAWHIWVRLKSEANSLVVEVEDDGTGVTKIPEFVRRLKKKNNTIKIRTQAIGASIDYLQGARGLLAIVKLNMK